jgi:hypothetical protein
VHGLLHFIGDLLIYVLLGFLLDPGDFVFGQAHRPASLAEQFVDARCHGVESCGIGMRHGLGVGSHLGVDRLLGPMTKMLNEKRPCLLAFLVRSCC